MSSKVATMKLGDDLEVTEAQLEAAAAHLRAHFRWSPFLLADITSDNIRTVLAALMGRELN